MKPQIFVFTGKYLNGRGARLTIITYFLGRSSVVMTPVKCEMTKYYFYDSFLRFRYTLSLIVNSVDPGTQHSRSYSYAGNKGHFKFLTQI